MEYRLLTTSEELEACIAMQKTIWGLGDDGVTSPITLKALSMQSPPVGLVTGAFDGDAMVGFSIVMATMTPGVVYAHMLGVLEERRDKSLGMKLFEHIRGVLQERGVHTLVGTYEPLESRNAYVYINKWGGRVVSYQDDCFHVSCAMHDGLPLDRLLFEIPVDAAPRKALSADEVSAIPVATPDAMPDADAVRVEIPGDLAVMKRDDFERVRRFRLDTRAVFGEYLNRRGYAGCALLSDMTPQGRRSFYLLERREGA